MNIKTLIKTTALTAMVGVGSVYAADATIGGNIPLNSSVIIYPERLLDFSADAALLKMADIVVTNNAPEFRINVSFDQDGIDFLKSGAAVSILQNMAFGSTGGSAGGWGFGLQDDGSDDGATGHDFDTGTDAVAAAGDCGTLANTSIDLTAETTQPSAYPGCLTENVGVGTGYTAATDLFTFGNADGTGWAAQTTPTVNAIIEVQGSWTGGETAGGDLLLAGTYNSIMTVTVLSNY
jgi:hypothetical protein